MDKYTIAHTKDEFGQDRWFVEDEHCDWVAGPYDTSELAADQARLMNAESPDTCDICGEEEGAHIHTDTVLHPDDEADGLFLHPWTPLSQAKRARRK